jgi:hypothetical protein
MGFILAPCGLRTENFGAEEKFGLSMYRDIHVPKSRLAQKCVLLARPEFLVIFCITLTPQNSEKVITIKK